MQKKEYTLGGGGEALAEEALGPGAADDTLGLFLLPAGRPGRRFTGADDEATAVAMVALFLLLRGRPQPRFSIGALILMGLCKGKVESTSPYILPSADDKRRFNISR
jgi:hypothetical protein